MDAQSSEVPSRNTYGDIHIDGNAHVLLGDQNVSNLYRYNVGNVSLLVTPKQRLTINRSAPPAHQYRTSKAALRARKGRGQRSSLKSQEQVDVRTSRAVADARRGEVLAGQTDSTIYEQILHLLGCLYEQLRNVSFIPRIPTISLPEQKEERPTVLAVYNAQDEDSPRSAGWSISPAGRDLLVLSAASLSLLLGRNLSTQDILRLLMKCQQDQLVPLLTFLLGFGLYRYLALTSLSATPTTQYFLTLEDAYGRSRPVAMDVCVDFSVLRQFLLAHYRQTSGTAGEALVKAGQFHLLLGSRRGRLIEAEEWCTPGRIKKGSRIVNSVFVSVNDTKCPACSTIFTVTGKGEFLCESCQTYHRDYDTFYSIRERLRPDKPFQERTPSTSPHSATTLPGSKPDASRSSRGHAGAVDSILDWKDDSQAAHVHYTVVGLKNVDVRVLKDRGLSRGDGNPSPPRWVQFLSEPISQFADRSQISCYDLPNLLLAQKDHARHELLCINSRDGFALYFDYQGENGYVSLRLTYIQEGVATEKGHFLSDLTILQTGLSLNIDLIESNGATTPWIVVKLPSREHVVLFYNAFIALRWHDLSPTIPAPISVDALFEEIIVVSYPMTIQGSGQLLFVYHDRGARKARLETTPLDWPDRWKPAWTAFIDLESDIIPWYPEKVNQTTIRFHRNVLWNRAVYKFSDNVEPPAMDHDMVLLTFRSQEDADEFWRTFKSLLKASM